MTASFLAVTEDWCQSVAAMSSAIICILGNHVAELGGGASICHLTSSLVTKTSVQTFQCDTLRRLIWFSKKTNPSSSSCTCYNPCISKYTGDLEHLLKHYREAGLSGWVVLGPPSACRVTLNMPFTLSTASVFQSTKDHFPHLMGLLQGWGCIM